MEYSFSERVRNAYWWTVGVTLLLSVGIVFLRLPDFQSLSPMHALFRLAVTASFPVTLFFRLIFVVRPYIYTSFQPRQTHLLIKGKGSERRIDYSQIESVRWSWLPMFFGGGLILRLKTGQRFRLFSLIDGHEEIVKDYVSFLPANLLPRTLEQYPGRSDFSRQQRQRTMALLAQWRVFLFFYIIFPCVLSLVSYFANRQVFSDPINNFILVLVFSTFLASLIWFVQEVLFSLLHRMGQSRLLKVELYSNWLARALHIVGTCVFLLVCTD